MKLVHFLTMVLEKTKKLWFPGLLLAIELIIIVLFGLLVEYDDGGRAGHEEEIANEIANRTGLSSAAEEFLLQLESTRSTTKVYPCKLNYWFPRLIVPLTIALVQIY